MDEIREHLYREWENHPDMEVQDGIKFLFQAIMGCGHGIADEDVVLGRLRKEMEESSLQTAEPITILSREYVRLPLSATTGAVREETVSRMFVQSAQKSRGSEAELVKALPLLHSLPFDKRQTEKAIEEYTRAGLPAVRHSERYRKLYSPHYRVIRREYLWLFPVLVKADQLSDGGIIALDGPCGSGKTTAASLLQEIYDCNVFHMDDFFLPPDRKTVQRMAEIGGNVEYERVKEQILQPLLEKKQVSFSPYSCQNGGMMETKRYPKKKLNIIEGSYSMHPTLQSGYDVRVFLEISPEKQMERIRKRNGPEAAERFRSQWIPLENRYFEGFAIRNACDVILAEQI